MLSDKLEKKATIAMQNPIRCRLMGDFPYKNYSMVSGQVRREAELRRLRGLDHRRAHSMAFWPNEMGVTPRMQPPWASIHSTLT